MLHRFKNMVTSSETFQLFLEIWTQDKKLCITAPQIDSTFCALCFEPLTRFLLIG